MNRSRRTVVLAACLTVAGVLEFGASPAQAQARSRSYVPNTYADFPYNQGSLFYKPLGSNASTRRRPAKRRYYVAPPRSRGPVYYYPAPTFRVR
jgi:hypothetical protein